MLKWIVSVVAIMALTLWLSGVRAQQVTIYTGANGQYLGQAIVMSPTQPPPPVWSPNGQ
jgi:hypothetical protein